MSKPSHVIVIPGSIVAWLVFAALSLVVGACADLDPTEPEVSTVSDEVVVQCTRDVPGLRSLQSACTVDVDCPCGSYCDTARHACRFDCMLQPLSAAEACVAGSSCDPTGRCVAPGAAPPSSAPALSANPKVLEPTAGGPAQAFQVRLDVATSAGTTTAQTTKVRVVPQGLLEVSCDGTSFASECTVNSWQFALAAGGYRATKQVYVRAPAAAPAGSGSVVLEIKATGASVVVAAPVSTDVGSDGSYLGVATTPMIPDGVAITAQLRGNQLVVRDLTRVLAPDSALLLDVVTASSSGQATARRTTILRPIDEAANASAITGDYVAGQLTTDASGGIAVPVTFTVPGVGATTETEIWTLKLSRIGSTVNECTAGAPCTAGNVCSTALGVCLPALVATPPTAAAGNQLDDPGSDRWWSAIAPMLGTGGTAPPGSEAFATTGPDLIESLFCSTDSTEAGAGRLGTRTLSFGTLPSRSGDLGCVATAAGTAISSAGPVGLVSRFDRTGADDTVAALVASSLDDLARPAATTFAGNFSNGVGEFVNPARVVPALRLLATGELGKQTQTTNPRARGLFVRLVQQWVQLHGLIASGGLSSRAYDDALASTPGDARAGLMRLLDAIDAGWGAVLDRRIAAVLPQATAWSSLATGDNFDYRTAKQPVVYWPFNGGSPTVDVIRNVVLSPSAVVAPARCRIDGTLGSIWQDWNCPGFRATLPASAPSIADGKSLSVTFALDDPDTDLPTYAGGTVLATETMAVVQYPNRTFAVVHPTADGGTEWVSLGGVSGLGAWTNPPNQYAATALAVVRDVNAKTYTLYSWEYPCALGTWCGSQPAVLRVVTRSYYQPVAGRLLGVGANQVFIGAGPPTAVPVDQPPYLPSFAGFVDDVAIFNAPLSRREFVAYGQRRGRAAGARAAWPSAMVLGDAPVQELTTPLDAVLLETQESHLDVVARLIDEAGGDAQLACEIGDATARARRDAVISRVGRTLRQSLIVQAYVRSGSSSRGDAARKLLAVKRGEVVRAVRALTECHPAFGLRDGDIPLYFQDINPTIAPKEAFFAASDYLLTIADRKVAEATTALADVKAAWDREQQSRIQQQELANARADRLAELRRGFGGELQQLCGLDRTPDAIMLDVLAGTFSVDSCFVAPTVPCTTANASGAITDADPSCYRGGLGGSLMEMRAAGHAEDAAQSAWQAAVGNTKGAELLCIQKEVNAKGCTATDLQTLSGVTCPPSNQGTLSLIANYTKELASIGRVSSLFGSIVSYVTTAVSLSALAMSGGAGFLIVGGVAAMAATGRDLDQATSLRQQQHQATMDSRAIIADIEACWITADQYQRGIGSAEAQAREATDRFTAAAISFDNGLRRARAIVVEAPIAIARETNRPAVPIAQQEWLPTLLAHYRFEIAQARRYTYLALRAVEYDELTTYTHVVPNLPLRSEVLLAKRPSVLVQQLALLRAQTQTRLIGGAQPAPGHLTFDFTQRYYGVPSVAVSSFGSAMVSHARPVYSNGEYLGLGVRFSLTPNNAADSPTWRCGERLWRVNAAAASIPQAPSGEGIPHIKLYKRNVFASRTCDRTGFQISSLQPSVNLFIADGEPGQFVDPRTYTVADIPVADLGADAGALTALQNSGVDSQGTPSAELALQGMYGDYILLFPATVFTGPRSLTSMKGSWNQLYLRFDFLSADASPPPTSATSSASSSH